MGLETVELIMEVEDEFNIQIPDEDAQHIETCGQLHAYVLHRLCPSAGAPCPTAAAFYRLRRSILAPPHSRRSHGLVRIYDHFRAPPPPRKNPKINRRPASKPAIRPRILNPRISNAHQSPLR